jgi:Gas vesicle protein K
MSVKEIEELQILASELKQRIEGRSTAARWNADPEDVRRSVMQLVLTLVDFIRQVMERQALRRMEEGTLTPEEIEKIGLALMKLEETVHDLARQSGLEPKDLNLDLGPLGRLT